MKVRKFTLVLMDVMVMRADSIHKRLRHIINLRVPVAVAAVVLLRLIAVVAVAVVVTLLQRVLERQQLQHVVLRPRQQFRLLRTADG